MEITVKLRDPSESKLYQLITLCRSLISANLNNISVKKQEQLLDYIADTLQEQFTFIEIINAVNSAVAIKVRTDDVGLVDISINKNLRIRGIKIISIAKLLEYGSLGIKGTGFFKKLETQLKNSGLI